MIGRLKSVTSDLHKTLEMVDSKVLERVLATAYPRWKAWLRLRHPSLRNFHAEIIQDAATDLTEYARSDRAPTLLDDDLLRIGFKILKNRMVDAYRSKTYRWFESLSPDQLPSASPSSEPDARLRYAKVLRWVVGYVSRLSRNDRALILGRTELASSEPASLSGANRQRLSRLRAQLRQELLTTRGIDIREYLKGD
jgi:hypothetical protein